MHVSLQDTPRQRVGSVPREAARDRLDKVVRGCEGRRYVAPAVRVGRVGKHEHEPWDRQTRHDAKVPVMAEDDAHPRARGDDPSLRWLVDQHVDDAAASQ